MMDRRGFVRPRVAAATLAILLGACTPMMSPTPGTTEPSGTGGPSNGLLPTPASTASSVATLCALADLKASHGRVEGAAGSRFTTVVLVSAVGCSVDAFPAAGLRDAQGTILVSAPAGGPGRIDLAAGSTYESNVHLGNWCADQPAFPLDLALIIGGDELPVTGDSFAGEGDLPPCSGEGGPVLEASAWEASP